MAAHNQPMEAMRDSSYQGLARLMAASPELLILRTFSELNAKNLLYYQAELSILEYELSTIEQWDEESPDRRYYNRQWSDLTSATREHEENRRNERERVPELTSATREHEENKRNERERVPELTQETAQWAKILEIRRLLTGYNNALIQQSQIANLPQPHKKDLQSLRSWLTRREFGDDFLTNTVEGVWDRQKKNTDFVAFQAQGGISYEISRLLLWIWRRCSIPTLNRVFYLNGSVGGFLGRAFSTFLTSVLPVVPIIILWIVDPSWIRMVLIVVFTGVAALVLVWGMKLKPDQALGITLALAAIQVVYVGTTQPRNANTCYTVVLDSASGNYVVKDC